jgi:hypothetical protein
LPDVNVWLALAFEVHEHHRRAVEWFDTLAPRSCAFCRFTQQGFLRLATNPVVLKDDAVTMAEAWRCYDTLMSDDRVLFLQEPAGLEQNWRRHTRKRKYSHKVWNETFDHGFRDYENLKPQILGE